MQVVTIMAKFIAWVANNMPCFNYRGKKESMVNAPDVLPPGVLLCIGGWIQHKSQDVTRAYFADRLCVVPPDDLLQEVFPNMLGALVGGIKKVCQAACVWVGVKGGGGGGSHAVRTCPCRPVLPAPLLLWPGSWWRRTSQCPSPQPTWPSACRPCASL